MKDSEESSISILGIILFLLCTFIFSIFFQNLYKFFIISNNWQKLSLFKILIFSLSLNIIFLCLLLRKYVIGYLSSPKLNLILLSILGISLILRNLIHQRNSLSVYDYNLREIANIFFLHNIFQSWWFFSILLLLFFSSFFSILVRGKYQKNKISFYLIHSGIVFILAGIFILYSYGWQGELILKPGKEESRVKILSGNQKTKWHQLDYKVKLIDYKIDYYIPGWKLNLYQRNDRTGDYKIISSISPYERRVFTVPKTDWKYQIANYYPDFRPEKEVIKLSIDKPLSPAVKIKIISNEEEKVEWLLANEKNIYLDENERFQVTFLWEWDREVQRKFVFGSQPEKHLLRINTENKEKIISVQIGRRYRWRNFYFSILKFLPHFRYDLNSRSPYSLSEKPENPALLVRIERVFPPGKGLLVWLFSRLQGFEALSLFGGALKLEYSYIPPKFGMKQYVVITGADKTLRFIKRRSFLIIPFEFGVRYKLNGKEIQILEMHPAVETKIKFTTRSNLPKNPAIYLVLKSPFKEMPFLKESGSEPIILEGGKYILNFENGKKILKNAKSHLKILFPKNREENYWIDKFQSVKIRKNYFLQGPLNTSKEVVSKIYISYKPGLRIFYLGFLLCLTGLLMQLLKRTEYE